MHASARISIGCCVHPSPELSSQVERKALLGWKMRPNLIFLISQLPSEHWEATQLTPLCTPILWWWWICEALRTFGAFAWMCSTWSPSNKIKQARLCFTRRDLCTLPSYETLRADWPSSRLAVDGWMDKKWHEKIVRFLILRKKLICAAFLAEAVINSLVGLNTRHNGSLLPTNR